MQVLEQAIKCLAMDAECSEEQLIAEAFATVGKPVPASSPSPSQGEERTDG